MPRPWLIVNPRAGRKLGLPTNAFGLDAARDALERQGVPVEVHPTGYAGHATVLARQAARAGVELVVAAGGDGTVQEVAHGLIGTATTLGVLPLGSFMNVARSLNVPRALDRAAAIVRAGRRVRMDVGLAQTRRRQTYFLEAAGVGLIAGTFNYTGRLDAGDWGAGFALVRYLLRYRPRRLRLRVDGQARIARAYSVAVAVGPYTGASLALAPDARIDDRWFDVVLLPAFSQWQLARYLLSIANGRRFRHPQSQTAQGRLVQVQGLGRRLPVHADGHYLGPTPARFELIPGALSVLVGEAAAGEPSAVAGPVIKAPSPSCSLTTDSGNRRHLSGPD